MGATIEELAAGVTPGSLAAVAAAALEALASRRDMLDEGEKEKEKEICPGDNPFRALVSEGEEERSSSNRASKTD